MYKILVSHNSLLVDNNMSMKENGDIKDGGE